MRPDVAWHDATTRPATALATHATALLGAGVIASGRLCRECGSDRHGRPWLRHDGSSVHVSLARSGAHLVTAIAGAPVGVDVEVEVIDVLPELVLAPGETADLARAWTRKEAVLKARGTGMTAPMSDVVLAHECWEDIEAPQGYVAAVSLLP